MLAHRTNNPELYDTLGFVGELLGVDLCWYYRGGFHFEVNGGDYTVSISPESAGRYRVESCHLTVPTDTKWVRAQDRARLALLVRSAADATAVVA